MSTNQTTADNTQHAGQHTGKLETISNKLGGLGDIIRGTGEIIHGHIPGAGDSAHGGKAAIKTAGAQRVERGLDRIDGKPTNTSAAGGGNAPSQDWERDRVGDGNGAAPTTAPQASTAAPRADDPTSQKDRGAAADTRHPVDRGAAATIATAGATAAGTRGHGPAPEQRHRDDDSERAQAAASTPRTPPRDRPTIANGLDEHDADMSQRQHGDLNGTVSSDQDKLYPETAHTASPTDRPTPVDAKRDTDVRQQDQENKPATGTSDEQARTTTDALDPVNVAAGRHDPSRLAASGSPPGLQGVNDVRQQENGSASASPSASPAAADAQSDTDVRQQVQENEPATGTSGTTTTDALDPANLASGRHDSSRPATSGSPPDLQGYFDERQEENGSSSASPNDRPAAADAQSDADVRQQVQENEPATGTSRTTTTESLDPANLAAGRHDSSRPATSDNSPGVQGITDVRQQGNESASTSLSASPVAADAQRDTDVRQQVQENEPATDTSDKQTRTITDAVGPLGVQGVPDVRQQGNGSTSASPSDRPAAADAQSDNDVRQQVQENESATDTGRTTTTDALDPANLAAGRHDPSRPATSGSPPGLQGYDVRQQGSGSSSASPSDRPAAADAQSDTDVHQQVQENEPATGTSRTTTTDSLDPANLTAGRHDSSRPATSDNSPGVQGITDVRQQGNGSASASLSASPGEDDAQSDTDVRQQVQENEPATDTSDKQTRTITDALDPADLAVGPLGVQGVPDVRQQGNGSASASPGDRPTSADAQSDTDVHQQVQENEPATGTSRTTTTDALDPANLAAGRHDPSRPATSGSPPGLQGHFDVRQQGNGSASASPSASPAAADAQSDTDVRHKVQENEPASDTGRITTTYSLDPANLAAGRHDRSRSATSDNSPGVQGITDVRQQGNDSASTSLSASPAEDDAQRDTDVRQQVQETEPAIDTSDKQTRTITDALDPANLAVGPPDVRGVTDVRQQGNGSASASPGDRPTSADAKRDTDVHQQVQENEPATDTSDKQTRTITDALYPANEAAVRHDPSCPAVPSSPPDVQGVTDVRLQRNESASASPSASPAAADAQRDTDVRQQVQENEPATDTSDKQTRTITDGLDLTNLAVTPLGVRGVTDVRQQGNESASASPTGSGRPTVTDAKCYTDDHQQVQENEPATDTSDKQTRTITDALYPANEAMVRHDLSRPAAPSSPPGVQGVTDVHQQVQENGPVTGTSDKQTRTTTDTPDPANLPTERHDPSRPAASGTRPGVQSVTDTPQQGNGFASSGHDKAHWQETRAIADTSHPVNTAVGQERSSETVPQA